MGHLLLRSLKQQLCIWWRSGSRNARNCLHGPGMFTSLHWNHQSLLLRYAPLFVLYLHAALFVCFGKYMLLLCFLCYKSYKLDLWWTKKVRFCWSRMLNYAAATAAVMFERLGLAAAVQRRGLWILSSGEKHCCPLEINNELRSRAIFFTWLTSGYCEQCEEGVIAVKLVKLCRVCCHQKWQPQDVNGNGVCSCSVMEKA